MVYVLSKNGKPLMPTARHGKVRRMLRDGKAHVVRLMPFTIQLDYNSDEKVQEVSLGIDAGSKHIGVSATTKDRELLAVQVEERDDIVKLIASRREARRTRRNRKLRHRAARFDNRRRKKGWLAPSIENRVSSHLRIIRLVNSILPISKTTIEVAQFDMQKIQNDKISGIEYQQGDQLGFWNVREYVLSRDKHTCQHCKGKSKDPVLNVHHIESRKTGGNAPNNLITLCETCHKAYHLGKIELKVKRGHSLRDAAVMSSMRWETYNRAKAEFSNVSLTYGYQTKHTRIINEVEKTHCADAFCIAGYVHARRLSWFYLMRLLQRHTRSLHVFKPAIGGNRKSHVGSHWIGKSRLQKYDYVEWNGIRTFISGSTDSRYLYLKRIDGLKTADKRIRFQDVKFIRRKCGSMIIDKCITKESDYGNK